MNFGILISLFHAVLLGAAKTQDGCQNEDTYEVNASDNPHSFSQIICTVLRLGSKPFAVIDYYMTHKVSKIHTRVD